MREKSRIIASSVPAGFGTPTIAVLAVVAIVLAGGIGSASEPDGYLEWAAAKFSASELADPSLESSYWGAGADPENDRAVNLIEYAFGSDPLFADFANRLHFGEISFGFVRLELSVRDDPNLFYTLQSSGDLSVWADDSSGWIVLDSSRNGFQTIAFLSDPSVVGSRFFRVRVDLNTPPEVLDDTLSVMGAMGPVVLDVFQNDHDADGDRLTMIDYLDPAYGSLSFTRGKFIYEPAAGFSGRDTFEYTLRDSRGASRSARVVVNVQSADDGDADQLPDTWELQFGLDSDDASDQMADLDRDGYPNLYEYLHQSDPTDRYSVPVPSRLVASPAGLQLALLEAQPFDIIALAEGEFAGGDWRFPQDRPIMVVAAEGPGTTIIDPSEGGRRRAFNFDAGQDSRNVISGLVVRNGHSGNGAALRFVDDSAATILDCVFENCGSEQSGGAIYIRGSAPSFGRCTFRGGESGNFGGAIYATAADGVSFADCTFSNNHAQASGGAAYMTGASIAAFSDCDFRNNSCGGSGGALAFGSEVIATVLRCTFVENACAADGGGISCRSLSRALLASSVFTKNEAVKRGGGIYSGSGGRARLHHCTLTDNLAASGGAAYHFKTSLIEFRNSILWGNQPEQLLGNGGSDVADCIVQGGQGGERNLSEDPALLPSEIRFRLGPNSPALGAAGAGASTAADTDIDGEVRGIQRDIGADEFTDEDADRMADSWEIRYGLNTGADDSADDLDNDGETNLSAYLAGGDPTRNLSPVVSVAGIVDPEGAMAGIHVVLVARPDSWRPKFETVSSAAGRFEISGIPRGGEIWVRVFWDADGDGMPGTCEPATGPDEAILISLADDISDLNLTLPPADSEAPVLVGVPADLVVQSIRDVPPVAEVSASDRGKDVDVEFDEVAFAPGSSGTIVRTWEALDDCGNRVTASQTITVELQRGGGGRYLTSFEPSQAYTLGPLAGQDGWLSSSGGFAVSGKRSALGGSQSLAANLPNAEAVRPLDAAFASLVELKFSIFLDGAAGRVPDPSELTQSASAIVSYDAALGIMALDGDGAGGGTWLVVPGILQPNQWREIRIVKDDVLSTWSVSISGGSDLQNLGFKNRERRGLSRLRIKNAPHGSLYLDNLSVIHEE